jgi:cytochrome b pre-mRNA-processing protein 3
VRHSRSPIFYEGYDVPDTIEGRFEMITLHGGLLVNRLCQPDMGAEGRMLAQAFFDVMFFNLDWSIRELGVGDLGVPRRIKQMMTSFKGRAFAYDEAMKSGKSEIAHALIRNLYATSSRPSAEILNAMAAYMQDCGAVLKKQGLSDFWLGSVEFPHIEDNRQGTSDVHHAA